MDLVKFASSALELARKLGLDDMELVLTSYSTLGANIENRDVTLAVEEEIFTAGVRALKKGLLAYVPVTEPSPALLETGIRTALAKAGPAPFDSFARITNLRDGLEVYDTGLAALVTQPARLRDLALDIVGRAYKTGKIETLNGGAGVVAEERLVTTLHSQRHAFARRTQFGASVEVNSRDFEYSTDRRLPDLEAVADSGAACARALPAGLATPDSEGVKGRRVPCIIHPLMLSGILHRLVAEHVYASTVQDGMSRYRLGDRVAPDSVTLWDDATAPWGQHTFPTDDEGTTSRRNLIIENGILRSFVYDRASARRDGVESTGNGRRRPVLVEENHEAPVRCSFNDLFLKPGDRPLAEMVRGIGRGLVVKTLLGFHTSNRTTGDFASSLYHGRVVRDGEIAALPEPGRWPVKGNALDLLRNVTAVSSETLNTDGGVLPWVQVDLDVG